MIKARNELFHIKKIINMKNKRIHHPYEENFIIYIKLRINTWFSCYEDDLQA